MRLGCVIRQERETGGGGLTSDLGMLTAVRKRIRIPIRFSLTLGSRAADRHAKSGQRMTLVHLLLAFVFRRCELDFNRPYFKMNGLDAKNE